MWGCKVQASVLGYGPCPRMIMRPRMVNGIVGPRPMVEDKGKE